MGWIWGIFVGKALGIALMAGWKRKMVHCGSKRIAKVFDKDIGQDKRLGTTKLPLIDLEAETEKKLELRLLPSLDILMIKDKKDRGTVTVKAFYHKSNKKEQLAAPEEEKIALEENNKLKDVGVIGGTVGALDRASTLVGFGIGVGVGLVGTGAGAGVGIVGSGLGAVGSGLSKSWEIHGKKHRRPFGPL